VRALAGVPSQSNVFYMAQVNGGVWKTDDYGRTWNPIFDDQPTGSVGSIAIAPSDPNIIYVGSGEGLQRPDLSVGDGIYKSTDAGKTWTHLGLRDGQQIPQIAVDPRNAKVILVAVAGHPYAPNEERGIFRSSDGGQTFDKVLYKDENVGGADVVFDPKNPEVAYAGLWEARQWNSGRGFQINRQRQDMEAVERRLAGRNYSSESRHRAEFAVSSIRFDCARLRVDDFSIRRWRR